mmetsp:Transcript_13526/g.35994  ORF Transcript_13526/g.35994 Transcript_13526/m.35994 type:complete len:213 (+) Transcript_13526:1034-1672(+)
MRYSCFAACSHLTTSRFSSSSSASRSRSTLKASSRRSLSIRCLLSISAASRRFRSSSNFCCSFFNHAWRFASFSAAARCSASTRSFSTRSASSLACAAAAARSRSIRSASAFCCASRASCSRRFLSASWAARRRSSANCCRFRSSASRCNRSAAARSSAIRLLSDAACWARIKASGSPLTAVVTDSSPNSGSTLSSAKAVASNASSSKDAGL